jgi:tripartite ATP-independent transporter DctM subunit
MTALHPTPFAAIIEPSASRPKLLPARIWAKIENSVIVFALASMVLLPLLEILFRKAKMQGISGSTSFIQHGCLVVGLIGAAIAAREDRLLSLATTAMFPRGWPQAIARMFSAGVASAISAMLAVGSYQFVEGEREAGKILAYGIPVWVIQALLPLGFGMITLRVLWHSADRWRRRWIAPLLAICLITLCMTLPVDPSQLVIPLFVVLLVAMILGAPIFALLGGSALILFWGADEPLGSISIAHYSLVTNPSLPTIPLFTLAGYFLAESGASKRLVRVFAALFGRIRGGPAIVTAVLCAFFTSFTGASGVTILALGGVLMPILLSAKYSNRAALGLLTGAGSLGMLFPPCLPLILYAIIANQPIEKIFLGAILPGFVLLIMTAILGVLIGPKTSHAEGKKFELREAGLAIWEAKWELLMPVVALVGLLGGFATPVEASAITAAYAFVTQTFIWRDLSLRKDVPHVIVECGLVIGGVLLILGLAQGFTNYLIDAQIPQTGVTWVTASIHSRFTFLLLLNAFLLLVGGLMDIYPAIVVVVPLLVPIGRAFGVDPIHLGIIFLANLELGFMMPPAGLNLLLSSYRFKKPMSEVCRSILPILLIQLVGVLLITYVPALTTALPAMISSSPNH